MIPKDIYCNLVQITQQLLSKICFWIDQQITCVWQPYYANTINKKKQHILGLNVQSAATTSKVTAKQARTNSCNSNFKGKTLRHCQTQAKQRLSWHLRQEMSAGTDIRQIVTLLILMQTFCVLKIDLPFASTQGIWRKMTIFLTSSQDTKHYNIKLYMDQLRSEKAYTL